MFNKIISAIACSAVSIVSIEAAEPVKIISWWGYFDDQVTMKSMEEICNAAISVDEYYTNEEFARRSQNSQYDILIYSETASDLVEKKFENNAIDIAYLTKEYHSIILKKYNSEKRKSNTVFFALAGTMFLWDEKQIKLESYKSILDFLKEKKKKPFVVLDDPLEIYSLLEYGLTKSEKEMLGNRSLEFYGADQYLNSKDVIFSNHLISLLQDEDFSVAYAWSGEVLEQFEILQNKVKYIKANDKSKTHVKVTQVSSDRLPVIDTVQADYRYAFHINFSHISKDLLTLTSNSKASRCIAELISNGSHHDDIMSSSYYISPSLSVPVNADDKYRSMLIDFESKVSKLPWKLQLPKNQYQELSANWQKIKLGFGQ